PSSVRSGVGPAAEILSGSAAPASGDPPQEKGPALAPAHPFSIVLLAAGDRPPPHGCAASHSLASSTSLNARRFFRRESAWVARKAVRYTPVSPITTAPHFTKGVLCCTSCCIARTLVGGIFPPRTSQMVSTVPGGSAEMMALLRSISAWGSPGAAPRAGWVSSS